MTERPLCILTIADVPPDPNSGAGGTVYHTNVALRELGHDVDEIWEDDLGPRRIGHGNLHSLLEQPRAYRRAVMQAAAGKDYDVVMMSQPQAYLAAKALRRSGFAGLVINRSHGVELRLDAVLTAWHRRLSVRPSRFPALSPVLRSWLGRQWPTVVRFSDGVVVPSEEDRDCLLGEIAAPPHKVRTIHHGISAAFLMPGTISCPDEQRFKRLLYVGQHAFVKAPHILARIVNRVLAAHDDVTMTWVTPAAVHESIRSGIDARIADRVTLQDWLPQERLIDFLDTHGVFVFPSFMEGAGKAALEAMSRGMCVIASNTGGMRDYLSVGGRGRLCPVGDVDAFVAAVMQSITDPSGAAAMGRAASEFACRKTWTACGEGITAYCRRLRRDVTRATEPRSKTSVQYDDWHAFRANAESRAGPTSLRLGTWHQMLMPRLGELAGLNVAEIGCGRGDFAIRLAQRGAHVSALDFSEVAIRIARERAQHHGVDVDWHVGDATDLPFEDGGFDLVVSCECLEHVREPQRMANELFRVCRPGGRVLLTTPSQLNGQIIAWIHSWVTRRVYNSGSGVQPHENLFFHFTVKRMLRRAGFRIRATDSRVFQFLLLPRVAPSKLRVDTFESPLLNRWFRPFGLHFLYELERPGDSSPTLAEALEGPIRTKEAVSTP